MNTDINTIAIVISLLIFVFAVLFGLFNKNKDGRVKRKYRPHPTRIDFALHHLRHKNIKKITNNLWEEITGVSDATASRDLGLLVEMGLLKKKGRSKSTYYIFTKHEKK